MALQPQGWARTAPRTAPASPVMLNCRRSGHFFSFVAATARSAPVFPPKRLETSELELAFCQKKREEKEPVAGANVARRKRSELSVPFACWALDVDPERAASRLASSAFSISTIAHPRWVSGP